MRRTYNSGMSESEVSFYDVRQRRSVTVPVSAVRTKIYERTNKKGSVERRFALRGPNGSGGWLTRFVSTAEYDRFPVAPTEDDLSLVSRLVVVRDLIETADVSDLDRLSHREFEVWVAHRYELDGYGVELTRSTRDGGVDIFVSRTDPMLGELLYLIECKHPDRRKVAVGVVRALRGVVSMQRATGGVVVTSGFFTAAAHEWAEAEPEPHRIALRDRDDLKRWIQTTKR